MKKVISLFLSLTMLLSIVSVIDFSTFADTLTTGNCGDNVTYSFDESTGVLTISGTGDMKQWPEYDSPWCADTRIKTLIIDEGVTSIGDRAFQDCRNLSNVKLPNSLTLIYNDAFSNCTSLASVIIPDSVTSIGDDAFEGCISLKSIEISDNNKNYSSVDGVLFNKDKSVLVIYPAGKTDSVYSIPNSVTSIGNSAFSECTNLSNVTIPDSVISIGDFAFSNSTSLRSVTIPDSVTIIGVSAFYDCKNLINVTLPNSITSIDYSVFSDCTSITNITIPDSVTSIGDSAFEGCTSLTSITIPNSVTSIGNDAFYSCYFTFGSFVNNSKCQYNRGETIVDTDSDGFCIKDNVLVKMRPNYAIDEVSIPNGVIKIGDYAFEYCTSLTNITIPDSVTSIGDYAFEFCESLTNITIPDSVTSISDYAFEYCASLTSVTIGNSVTDIGYAAFSGCDNLKNIYYKGSQEEWNKINIRDNNNNLTNATIYYNFIACTQNNHNYFGDWTVVKEATCTTSGLKQRTCSYDGYTETIVIPATGHNFGNNSANCLVCGTANPNYVAPTPAPSPAPTPAPTPTPTPTQPTQTSKPVAKPKSAKIKKVKAAKKAIAVEWKKVSGVKGYQIQVATDKKFKKNKKTVTVKKQKTTKVTVKKLKAKKKYYVRIRTYKTVNGKQVYSSWSKVKTVKTK